MAYYNKIIANGETLIDLTSDTVTEETLYKGIRAHNAAGAQITGTATTGGLTPPDTDDYIDPTMMQIVQASMVVGKASGSSMRTTGSTITVSRTGYYRARWFGGRAYTSGTGKVALYKNNSAITTTSISSSMVNPYKDIYLTEGDVLEVRVSGTSRYYIYGGCLTLSIMWYIGGGEYDHDGTGSSSGGDIA